MCISATAARAFKSVLQGVLLSNEGLVFSCFQPSVYVLSIVILVGGSFLILIIVSLWK